MKTEWFEKENFWVNFAPIMFDDARWAEAPDVAEYVMKLANLKQGDSVLDAGCGLGRISVEMAALGLDVTGVDIIEAELQAAEESANAEGVKLNLVKADLRTFSAPKKYDCVVNLYTSFGYCDSIEEDMKILKNLCDSLKDNGTFIMMFAVKNEAGALVKVLNRLGEFGYNMVAIHSRPLKSHAWEYYFYIEVEGNSSQKDFEQMVHEIQYRCDKLKIFR